jgi:MFS family permease
MSNKLINRTVMVLSLVSLFADMASEMLYPVIPVYLQSIGFSILLIGVLEGLAEFTAGISKGYFGQLSDEKGKRLPFIKLGYLLSAISKPMMGFFAIPVWIFVARTVDRLGKGLRTAARDALLSQNATPETKGRVFAFHRGMDTMGAVLGPLLALLFLHLLPGKYVPLFFLAFVPGLISVLLIFLLKEKKMVVSTFERKHFFSFFGYWRLSSPVYRKLIPGLLLFAAFNSSDVFLLLKAKEISGSDTITITAYIFYNIVYAIASYPMGMLADRFHFKHVFLAGLILFAVVYFLFAISNSTIIIFIAFFLYGLYAAATEGIAKAWITNLAHQHNTATAIGFYTSCQSICSLLASVTAGFIWYRFNSTTLFSLTAVIALIVFIYLLIFCRRDENQSNTFLAQ